MTDSVNKHFRQEGTCAGAGTRCIFGAIFSLPPPLPIHHRQGRLRLLPPPSNAPILLLLHPWPSSAYLLPRSTSATSLPAQPKGYPPTPSRVHQGLLPRSEWKKTGGASGPTGRAGGGLLAAAPPCPRAGASSSSAKTSSSVSLSLGHGRLVPEALDVTGSFGGRWKGTGSAVVFGQDLLYILVRPNRSGKR